MATVLAENIFLKNQTEITKPTIDNGLSQRVVPESFAGCLSVRLEHPAHNLEQTRLLREVVIHEVDEVVRLTHRLNDAARRGVSFVNLPPLLSPQTKGLVLQKGVGMC